MEGMCHGKGPADQADGGEGGGALSPCAHGGIIRVLCSLVWFVLSIINNDGSFRRPTSRQRVECNKVACWQVAK